MAYSEAQRAATARYNKKAYDRIELVVPKGQKAEIKAFAEKHGKSVNGFINGLIRDAMREDAE